MIVYASAGNYGFGFTAWQAATKTKVKTINLEMQRERRKRRFFWAVTLANPFSYACEITAEFAAIPPKNLCFLRSLCISRFMVLILVFVPDQNKKSTLAGALFVLIRG